MSQWLNEYHKFKITQHNKSSLVCYFQKVSFVVKSSVSAEDLKSHYESMSGWLQESKYSYFQESKSTRESISFQAKYD